MRFSILLSNLPVCRRMSNGRGHQRSDYLAGRIQLVEGEEVFRKAMSKYA